MTEDRVRVRALFRIEPPAYFGLPDGSKVVVPASPDAPAEIVSPVLDTRSGLIVNHGSLPSYRSPSQAIQEQFVVDQVSLRLEDNFLSAELDADTLGAGVERARSVVVAFLRHLMVEQGDFFRPVLLQYEIEGKETHRASQPVKLMELAAYNLEEFRGRIRRAVTGTLNSDERLDRALVYYEQGRFLYKLGSDHDLAERHRHYLIASGFLFLWKAITTVLGEPGTDRDYQRRFKAFGLPTDFWQTRIQPLKETRDAADVAHYDLNPEGVAKPVSEFGKAEATCREVLKAYSEHLVRSREQRPDSPAT